VSTKSWTRSIFGGVVVVVEKLRSCSPGISALGRVPGVVTLRSNLRLHRAAIRPYKDSQERIQIQNLDIHPGKTR
jgi:hypothetical protein